MKLTVKKAQELYGDSLRFCGYTHAEFSVEELCTGKVRLTPLSLHNEETGCVYSHSEGKPVGEPVICHLIKAE